MIPHRPKMNYFGYIMKRITDPLIRAPVEDAVRAGVSDMAEHITQVGRALETGSIVGGTIAGLGNLSGGIIGGLGGAIAGMGLGELIRRRRIEKEQDMFVRKLVEQLGPRLPELNISAMERT